MTEPTTDNKNKKEKKYYATHDFYVENPDEGHNDQDKFEEGDEVTADRYLGDKTLDDLVKTGHLAKR